LIQEGKMSFHPPTFVEEVRRKTQKGVHSQKSVCLTIPGGKRYVKKNKINMREDHRGSKGKDKGGNLKLASGGSTSQKKKASIQEERVRDERSVLKGEDWGGSLREHPGGGREPGPQRSGRAEKPLKGEAFRDGSVVERLKK